MNLNASRMISYIGDYTCKVDSKGRVMLPAAFKRQMPPGTEVRFVIKRDIFEKCLILYPIDEWERQNKLIRSRTNHYNREHAQFLRQFYQGTAEVNLDASNRLLIPKRLAEYAEIDREVVMAGQYGKIEIWSEPLYGKGSRASDDFALMAEKILGGTPGEGDAV